MSTMPSNNSQQPGHPAAASSEQSAPNNPSRPGWLEIIVGLVVYAIVGFFGVSQFKRLGLDPAVYGLILTSWTGVATIIAFTVAARLRILSLSTFGVRRTSVYAQHGRELMGCKSPVGEPAIQMLESFGAE